MSKVSRSVLKSLVKECLVEILSEGLVGSSKQVNEARKRKAQPKRKKTVKEVAKTSTRSEIPETIKGVTSDPLMQSIFADTAKTTLVEQQSAERNPRVVAGDRISQTVDKNDPADLFGEAANNWAALAFSEKKLPGQHK